MTKINIVADVNMSEEREAEIFAAFAAHRGNVADILSVPYRSIFKRFNANWHYTQVEVLHEVIDMLYDKGSESLWRYLYNKTAKCLRLMRSKGRCKMSFINVLSETIHDYLLEMEDDIKHFYRIKRKVEEKITSMYYASGELERGDIFKQSIID